MLTQWLAPQAIHQIESVDSGETAVGLWRSGGDDPQFMLHPRRPLAAGWYVLAAELHATDGRLVRPTLYLDEGDGFTEECRIDLPLSPGKRQRLLLYFEHDIRSLRLDPSESPCVFALGRVGLRRISRVEAALRLLWPMVPRPLLGREAAGFLFAAAATGLRQRTLWRMGEPSWRMHQLRAQQSNRQAQYHSWCEHWEPRLRDLALSDRLLAKLQHPPLISIVLPVYNTPEAWLVECIESVLAQSYPYWELCIADDASSLAHVDRVLRGFAQRDARIRHCRRSVNGHICAASNTALQMAQGRFVALLDHDDCLPPYALLTVAVFAAMYPEARLLYSDEDKLGHDGGRCDPYFKPDFNPELLRGQNFISHLGVFDRELANSVGGFRPGFEGSQDYDLALRCLERLAPDQVRHIPAVLYHWRAHAGSTASAAAAKGYALESARRALQEHLHRTGEAATVRTDAGYLRVDYPLRSPAPKVSIIVPTRDRLELLSACVESLLGVTRYPDFEVLIVDNQSSEAPTLQWLAQIEKTRPAVRVLRFEQPFNFSRICNFAVNRAAGDMVCLLNNDTRVINPEWLAELVVLADRRDSGAVGAMLYYPDETIQHAGVILGIGGVAGHAYGGKPREYRGQMSRLCLRQELSAVTGACLLVRRDRYLEAGGMDEALAVAFNDVDLCLRLRQRGYRNLWTPYATLYHFESASRGAEDSPEKVQRFNREVAYMLGQWGAQIERDPAYNANLTLCAEPFTLDLARPAAWICEIERFLGEGVVEQAAPARSTEFA